MLNIWSKISFYAIVFSTFMYMITFDLMLNAQDQIRVDIKQNMFEFRTSLK